MSIVSKVLSLELQHFLDLTHRPILHTYLKGLGPGSEVRMMGKVREWKLFLVHIPGSAVLTGKSDFISQRVSEDWLLWRQDRCFGIRPECWRVSAQW